LWHDCGGGRFGFANPANLELNAVPDAAEFVDRIVLGPPVGGGAGAAPRPRLGGGGAERPVLSERGGGGAWLCDGGGGGGAERPDPTDGGLGGGADRPPGGGGGGADLPPVECALSLTELPRLGGGGANFDAELTGPLLDALNVDWVLSSILEGGGGGGAPAFERGRLPRAGDG